MTEGELAVGLHGRSVPEAGALARVHRRAWLAALAHALASAGIVAALVAGALGWSANLPVVLDALPLLMGVAATIALAFWLWEAYGVLPALSGEPTDRERWWAWGGLVIPFANLYVPYQITREIADGSDPDAVSMTLARSSPAPPLGVWWGVRIVSGIAVRLMERIVADVDPIPDGVAVAVMVAYLGLVVADALTVVVVLRIDRNQQALAARLAAATSA